MRDQKKYPLHAMNAQGTDEGMVRKCMKLHRERQFEREGERSDATRIA